MKKNAGLLIAAFLFFISSQAQTKWIAHRNHSGSDVNFSIEGADNFGLPRNEADLKKQKKRNDSSYLRMDSMIKIAADTVMKSCVPPLPKKKVKSKGKLKRHNTVGYLRPL